MRSGTGWPTVLLGRAPKTVSTQREVLEPLIGIIGAVPLRELTAATVRSALKELAATRATRTVGMAHAGLTRAIRHAEAKDKVRRNVATLVDTLAGHGGRPSKSLTFGQAVALIQAARPYGLYAGTRRRRGRSRPHRTAVAGRKSSEQRLRAITRNRSPSPAHIRKQGQGDTHPPSLEARPACPESALLSTPDPTAKPLSELAPSSAPEWLIWAPYTTPALTVLEHGVGCLGGYRKQFN